MKIRIERPDDWRSGKNRRRKPLIVKGADWAVGPGGSVTIWDKNGDPIRSLAEGQWNEIRWA